MITSLLTRHFGFDQLRPGQEAVISRLLAGKSAAAIFPTGAGKSLCYQLPALALPHLTLVISPLLALMHDQLAFLQRKGIAAATLDSSQTVEESRHVMQQASDGQLKILMISVERLKNERFRRFIAQVPLSLLVVDEAHCISEWGHNFRPDYLKLPDHRRELGIPQVLLLTATATPAVMADMQEKFAIDGEDLVVTGHGITGCARSCTGIPVPPPSSMSPCNTVQSSAPRSCRPAASGRAPTMQGWIPPCAARSSTTS